MPSRLLPLICSLIMLTTGCHETWRDCLTRCKAEPDAGNCQAAFSRYYFDADEGRCMEFTWGGCGGVVPFETLKECGSCDCDV